MKNLVSMICVTLLLFSCQDDITKGQKQYPQEKVSMKFALQAAGMSQPEYQGSPTRAFSDNGLELTVGANLETKVATPLPIESIIKDLVIMQFAGTEDDAALIGTPQYFPQYDAEPAIMNFIASNGDNHTIYFIANSGRDLGSEVAGKTLADFKRLIYEIPTEIKLIEGQGLLMVGSWTGAIANEADVKNVILSRAMAKIAFKLTNSLTGSAYIQSVSLENVPSSVAYHGEFDNTSESQITYPTKTYDGEAAYTWYVPENLNILKEKSTCIVVTVGLSGSAMVYPCRIYLNSSDIAPDYSLKRNYSYDISVVLRGTTSTVGELLVDCHYVMSAIDTKVGNVVSSDANWVEVSTSGAWTSGLGQSVTATSARTFLHIDTNLTGADRSATITVTDGVNTTEIPISQKAIQEVGLFTEPDADGIYTKTLGMEAIEENSNLKWYSVASGPNSYEDLEKKEIDTGKALTAKYGSDNTFEIFYDCYNKNKDKSNIQWYVPAQKQLWGMYVSINVTNLRTSANGYYSATLGTQNAPKYARMNICSWVSISGPERGRFVRCVIDIP